LFEVVIAMALSALLLSSVYAALDLSYKYVSAGRSDVQRDQVARGLLRAIEADLQTALQGRREEPVDPLPWGEATSQVELPARRTAKHSAADQRCGLIGDATSIIVYQGDHDQRWPHADDGRSDSGTQGDVKMVVYGLADRGQIHLPSDCDSVIAKKQLSVPGTGLIRAETRLPWPNARLPLEPIRLADRDVRLLTGEVSALRFRYFDGAEWRDDWNVARRPSLPVAIQVEVELNPNNNRREAKASVQRMVIGRPLAVPHAQMKPERWEHHSGALDFTRQQP
jgi:hypothetical protein